MTTPILTFDVPYREMFPDEVLPFEFDYHLWASVVADPIATATISAGGLTVGTVTVQAGGLSVIAFLSGAVAGVQYAVVCHGVTGLGMAADNPLRIGGISL